MQPLIVTHCLTVKANGTWEASVNGHKLVPSWCQPLCGLPLILNSESLQHLVEVLDNANACAGHPDDKFVKMMQTKKGKI